MTQPYRDPAPKPKEEPRMSSAERDSLMKELGGLHVELELLRGRYQQGRCHELAYVSMREALSSRLDKIRTRLAVLDVAEER